MGATMAAGCPLPPHPPRGNFPVGQSPGAGQERQGRKVSGLPRQWFLLLITHQRTPKGGWYLGENHPDTEASVLAMCNQKSYHHSFREIRSQGQVRGALDRWDALHPTSCWLSLPALPRLRRADFPCPQLCPWLTDDDTISSLLVSLNPSLAFVSSDRAPPRFWAQFWMFFTHSVLCKSVVFPKLHSFTTSMIFTIIT